MGFGPDDRLNKLIMSKNAPSFLLPFYKNLFAASILQKPNQTQNECKLFNAQNFPRNLLFSCGDDKEVNLCDTSLLPFLIFSFIHAASFIEIYVL
jgi:hypothetical protein